MRNREKKKRNQRRRCTRLGPVCYWPAWP